MVLIRKLSILMLIAVLSYAATAWARNLARTSPDAALSGAATEDVTDSVVLARQGIIAGRQLTVFVFGGSRCAACSSAEVQSAIRRMRTVMAASHGSAFSSISVVGVAINTDIREGLDFLAQAGLEHFDAISVGLGWRNEDVVRMLWSDSTRRVEVPRVVAVSRSLAARIDPVQLDFSRDSVLLVVTGRDSLAAWVDAGAPLKLHTQ
jgi:hypothetical protein